LDSERAVRKDRTDGVFRTLSRRRIVLKRGSGSESGLGMMGQSPAIVPSLPGDVRPSVLVLLYIAFTVLFTAPWTLLLLHTHRLDIGRGFVCHSYPNVGACPRSVYVLCALPNSSQVFRLPLAWKASNGLGIPAASGLRHDRLSFGLAHWSLLPTLQVSRTQARSRLKSAPVPAS
jgi:hypothetical protein